MKEKKDDGESIFVRYHWFFWILSIIAGAYVGADLGGMI